MNLRLLSRRGCLTLNMLNRLNFGINEVDSCSVMCYAQFSPQKQSLKPSFGERAFSHAGPVTWKALPDHICTVADPVKFRKLLKSHCFIQAFNIC